MSGRQHTWANRLPSQTFEKLDRILACIDFESKYPHTTVQALNREISDHMPLLLNTKNSSPTYQPQFKFELGWLLQEGFGDMVRQVWNDTQAEVLPLKYGRLK